MQIAFDAISFDAMLLSGPNQVAKLQWLASRCF